MEGWDIQLTDDEVRAMSNFMNESEFLVADDMLYGCFGGKKFGKGSFQMATVTDKDDGDIKDKKVIKKNVRVTYLAEHDDYIYCVLSNLEIVKIKKGTTKAKTIYEGGCTYLQIIGDQIYFSNNDYLLCKMDLNGKNVKTVIAKKRAFFPYHVAKNLIVYQDDLDNESLHIYNEKTKKDTKINDTASYKPILCGDYIYYLTGGATKDDVYYLNRIDMYSGKVEVTPDERYTINYFIEDGKITFEAGGMPSVKLENWDELGKKSYGGSVLKPKYSNGEIRIIAFGDGETLISNKTFSKSYEHSKGIGYNFVK